jgi:ABC-type transport system involved in cytochrome c biogenesis permease subunit
MSGEGHEGAGAVGSGRDLRALVGELSVGRVVDALSSYRLSVALLAGLLLLTWLGTLYQVRHGLWEAQKLYFESFVVLQRPVDVWVAADPPRWLETLPFAIPLPGGMTLMGLLGINLVFGGFVRIVRRMGQGPVFVRRLGVLVVHFGIAILLAASIVRHQTAVEGSLTLFEGQSSTTYHSFHEWEIAVRRQIGDGEVEELLIPGEMFLYAQRKRVFTSDALPFELVVEHAERNAEVRSAGGQMPEGGTPGVGGEGFLLVGKAVESANEQNRAGAVVSLRSDDAALDGRRAVVHALDRGPWTIDAGSDAWGIEIRKKTYPLPFRIRLDDFEAEMYPGTRKPKSFRSRVAVFEPGGDPAGRKVLIQMNEPLRVDGLVVYQSSWGPQGAAPGAPLFSGFQVVENVTDQWPLWGCIVIALGMTLVFGQALLRFMWRETRARAAAVAGAAPAASLLVLLASGGALTAQMPAGHPPVPGAMAQPAIQASGEPTVTRTTRWSDRAVELFRKLPLQSDGRIKPFHTEVSYLLLRLNGRRSFTVPDEPVYGEIAGERLDSTGWAMDALFFPEQADDYRVFLVQTSEVLDAIGIEHDERKKRDRYSFDELRPGFSELFRLAQRYDAIDAKQRTGLQEQVVGLARNVTDYDRLVRSFDPARIVFRTDDLGDDSRAALANGAPAVSFSFLMARFPLFRARFDELSRASESDLDDVAKADRAALSRILSRADGLGSTQPLLRWIPPADPGEREWCGAAELVHVLGRGRTTVDPEPVLQLLDLHEAMLRSRSQPDEFLSELETLDRRLEAWLVARGEGSRRAMEVDYLRADYKYRALLLFGAAFVLVTVSWLRPTSRWLAVPPWILTAVGCAVVVQDIVVRCIVRQRPPISTLFDTILFIAAGAVLASLLLEVLFRRRVFLSLGAVLGFVGMFLAARFEITEGRDTMPTLIAVLDTNFWLATHVTIINLGYAGTLLAGFIAHVFLIGQLLGMRAKDPSFFRGLGRATYGTLCFATLFTTVGTILGGIWANDSWGRFWGWDPKENGAMMIVLWCLVILHARLGNMVKDHGIAMLATAGNIIVVFSWFHTNLLGVGLHSYGFASGLATAVWSFYGLELLVLAIGHLGFIRYRRTTGASVGPVPPTIPATT